VDGLKTGYTEKAGYCLIASAQRDSMRLISVVLGTNSKIKRATESQKLLDYGFRFFETHELYKAKEILSAEKIWQGETGRLKLGLKESLYVTVPKGQYNTLETKTDIDKNILAPVREGEVHGTLKVLLGNEVIAERPLIALHDVGRGNVFNWLIDYIWLQFQ
jgi:D-alanyl-D-alanine carboxypeptidase (penicillin-binding protein 5/6)